MTRRRGWILSIVVCVYLVGLVLTHQADTATRKGDRQPMQTFIDAGRAVRLPPMTNDGPTEGEPLAQFFGSWGEPSERPPAILLHGSPGGLENFKSTRTRLGLGESLGRFTHVYALDLPGMGWSRDDPPTLSSRSHAHAVLAFMDAMGIDRAHIVGWSNGGAVAIHMADIDAGRVASIVMLGSVGAQEVEGSGSYWFEHAKYEIGIAATNAFERLTPHFGLLNMRDLRRGLRNFDDTDQRPLVGIMRKLRTPTLILHGRDDFLVADWAAEYHHELMPRSTLIMTEHDHFMPFLAAEDTAAHINGFIERFDDASTEPVRETIDLAPRVLPFGAVGDAALDWLHFAPWWLLVGLVAVAGQVFGVPGRAWIAVLVGATELDIGVAWLGLAFGKGVRTVRNGNGRRPGKWLTVLLDPAGQLLLGFLFVQLIARPLIRLGPDWAHGAGWVLATLAFAALFVVLPRIWTRRGRQRLRASARRALHHEWWPTWALYLPISPLFVWWSIRYRHPLAFTACNAGIGNGGGLAGESKADIIAGLLESGDARVLYGEAAAMQEDPAARADALAARVRAESRLGGWPVMLKPDAGEQGRGVTRCGCRDAAVAFFSQYPGPAMVQRCDPGPNEVGVFFVREPAPGSSTSGRILSINRKVFPAVVGDGRRTIESLVWDHPRYRCQGDLFMRHLGDGRARIPVEGERVQLTTKGNHAQGCSFVDAPELITAELEAAVCGIADGFRGSLDVGRFDLRYADEAELLAGGAFAVVEVNGVSSESTNLYDPKRTPIFAWTTLAAQWGIAYRIGAGRMRLGRRPLSVSKALKIARSHLRARPVH